jgi:hypothetical protein
VLRILSYPNCYIVVAAIYRRGPPSNVNNLAAQNDGNHSSIPVLLAVI